MDVVCTQDWTLRITILSVISFTIRMQGIRSSFSTESRRHWFVGGKPNRYGRLPLNRDAKLPLFSGPGSHFSLPFGLLPFLVASYSHVLFFPFLILLNEAWRYLNCDSKLRTLKTRDAFPHSFSALFRRFPILSKLRWDSCEISPDSFKFLLRFSSEILTWDSWGWRFFIEITDFTQTEIRILRAIASDDLRN